MVVASVVVTVVLVGAVVVVVLAVVPTVLVNGVLSPVGLTGTCGAQAVSAAAPNASAARVPASVRALGMVLPPGIGGVTFD
ncbi:hypothetical protein GCM10010174_28030 [Kutzneria viridogrisea]